MDKLFVKLFNSLIFIFLIVFLSACSSSTQTPIIELPEVIEPIKVTVPDVSGTNPTVAENILSNLGLVPVSTSEYSDSIEEGRVVGTIPAANSAVNPSSRVEVIISRGPRIVDAKNAQIEWYSVTSSARDTHQFRNPQLIEGVLVIRLELTFNQTREMKWKTGSSGSSEGFGNASISDTFDKTVPVRIQFENQIQRIRIFWCL
jgi:hypothetical protein